MDSPHLARFCGIQKMWVAFSLQPLVGVGPHHLIGASWAEDWGPLNPWIFAPLLLPE